MTTMRLRFRLWWECRAIAGFHRDSEGTMVQLCRRNRFHRGKCRGLLPQKLPSRALSGTDETTEG